MKQCDRARRAARWIVAGGCLGAMASTVMGAAAPVPATRPAIRSTPSSRPAAGLSIELKKIDGPTTRATLRGLRDGKLLVEGTEPGSAAHESSVPLEDVIEIIPAAGNAKAATPAAANAHKLMGTVIGTEGSYQDKGHTRDEVFDGKLNTFFDAPEAHAEDAWIGLDLGGPKRIIRVKYAPRPGTYTGRVVGARFQGSNTADFTSGVVELGTIEKEAPANRLTTQEVTVAGGFRYVRYVSATKGCNIAEIEFWGYNADGGSAAGAATQSAHGAPCEVALVTDDRLHGALGAWTEKQFSLSTPLAAGGSFEIPLTQVREVWTGSVEQVKQAKAIKLEPGPEDAAFVVKDGGVVSVRGIALGVDGESLRFKFNDQERKIGLAKLVGVVLGGQDAKRDDSFRQSVQLSGGDVVSGSWKTFDKNTVGLETGWGGKLLIPFASVTRISGINGRLVYLSDLKPARVEQTPYFDRLMPWRADRSLTGGPLKLIDAEYARGLAVHSRCVLEYEIGGKYETFAAKVGFQQPEGRLGRAVVRVLGDGTALYEDPDARGDAAKPADVSVKISGVNRLTLEVDFGKDEDTGDRVVWANARLLRAASQPTPK